MFGDGSGEQGSFTTAEFHNCAVLKTEAFSHFTLFLLPFAQVIFDDELSPGQLRNLEKVLGCGNGSVRVSTSSPHLDLASH